MMEDYISKNTDYITYKVELLYQFGLTDRSAVDAHLRKAKNEIQVDNMAATMLENFYNGDKTYVKKKKREEVN